MKLEVHRLHDDAHAALAEHAIHAVPARKDGTRLDATRPDHELRTHPPETSTITFLTTTNLGIVRPLQQTGPMNATM